MKETKSKIFIAGLPKTGTSTLTVMLRILNYKVTGPEIHYLKGENTNLMDNFRKYDAFQDYPWCYEWKRFLEYEDVRYIILKRNVESWWLSFYNSYGKGEKDYLSHSYIGLSKNVSQKEAFIDYFNNYYSDLEEYSSKFPNRFLKVNIESLEWEVLCEFLKKKLPKNLFGKTLKIPHVNKNNAFTKNTLTIKIQKKVRNLFLPIIGKNLWIRISISFWRIGIFR